MNLLAIDTSTDLATVAVLAHGTLYCEEQAGLREHAQWLLPMVERQLTESCLKFSQLDGVVFGCGPGSFTGLRVACSVAKGLAYAHDLPLYPVGSLTAIAHELHQAEPGTPVLAMLDARMHQVYWRYFKEDVVQEPEQVNAPEDIVLADESPFILAGVGFEHYVPLLPEVLQARIVKSCTIFPKASAMIRLVQRGVIKPVSAAAALPVYVRNQVVQEGT